MCGTKISKDRAEEEEEEQFKGKIEKKKGDQLVLEYLSKNHKSRNNSNKYLINHEVYEGSNISYH